jgi:hypothetical protein
MQIGEGRETLASDLQGFQVRQRKSLVQSSTKNTLELQFNRLGLVAVDRTWCGNKCENLDNVLLVMVLAFKEHTSILAELCSGLRAIV